MLSILVYLLSALILLISYFLMLKPQLIQALVTKASPTFLKGFGGEFLLLGISGILISLFSPSQIHYYLWLCLTCISFAIFAFSLSKKI